ncbi:WecB/TagA/CpsF family glycosyltransferase [Rhodococcus sp. F64268]|uniref:WecB/TagA/CpsF family glycosyltransferase n=1 Tax=Rhodococcus sp. F64268 TaxID=2926402 RepID=UPI001FF5D8AC|nr:WecB/TagA/CpsF family glycosyltransferase [Rhodococcus sp. F64268]MCK0090482.1 WecB/TagA/CpsF family glycosyltransferase [Rhodococcus sp. F64268]
MSGAEMEYPYSSEDAPLVRVGKVPFTVSNLDDATKSVISFATNRVGIPIRLANAYCVALAVDDSSYCSIFQGVGITYPDGAPVSWFMRRRNTLARTVRGPDLFCSVLDAGQALNIRHFFYGTTEKTLCALRDVVADKYPGAIWSGMFAPPFGAVTEALIDEAEERINRANPDIVWVALGTPKQDQIAALLAHRIDIPCIGVGAAFDFLAGTVKQAPGWIRGTGFEWVYRLAREPKRLWRRYLIGNPKFLYSAVFQSKTIPDSLDRAKGKIWE